MQVVTFGDYKVTANMEKIHLERGEDKFTFLPGEAARIKKVLGIALQMQDLKSLPSHISNTPFRVSFFEDDTLSLTRVDDPKSVFKLGWGDVDEFMQVVDKAVPVSTNDTMQSGNISRRRAASVGTGEPFF